jgi:ribosomal protein S6
MPERENDVSPQGENSDSRVYELGYLLVPTIPSEEVPARYGDLKHLISSLGGEIISDEMPKMIPLAYTMRKVISNVHTKFHSAYFGWIKFATDGEKVVELKNKLDLDQNIIRFLILKTVRENTIAVKRFMRADMPYRKTPSPKRAVDAGPVAPINKEEIDKEIDALVAN